MPGILRVNRPRRVVVGSEGRLYGMPFGVSNSPRLHRAAGPAGRERHGAEIQNWVMTPRSLRAIAQYHRALSIIGWSE